MTENAVQAVIHAAIDELNQQLPEGGKLQKAPAAVLVGDGGVLDSLGLITLLVDIEQALAEKLSIVVPLLDELMAAREGQHTFHSVGALTQWVAHHQQRAS
jgi:D-alanine--poly(phosphoribitol) ligase subunit 2